MYYLYIIRSVFSAELLPLFRRPLSPIIGECTAEKRFFLNFVRINPVIFRITMDDCKKKCKTREHSPPYALSTSLFYANFAACLPLCKLHITT